MKKFHIFLLLTLLNVSCKNKKVAMDRDVFYTCSMDPQVVAEKPGKCPICGMPLTAVKKSSVKNSDDIELSDQQIKLGNILVHTIQKGNIGNEMELTGTLNLDASRIASVNARVMGRIEKLYVKTTGDYVAKGSPLYELYSEELNSAKQEYIAALQRRGLFEDQSIIDFDNIIESARTKLRLWGMTETQIKVLEESKKAPLTTTFYSTESGYVTLLNVTEGSYLMEGGTIVELANLSTLWVDVQIYATQLYRVPNGGAATVFVSGSNKKFTGRIEFVNPEISFGTRINLLRVKIANKGNDLKPGMSVIVKVKTANRNSLTLPTEAVISNSNGSTVWIQSGKNKFRSQMITTGLESEGVTEVVSGLRNGDAVVIRGAYLLHSEFVFKRGADPMTSHSH